MKLLDKAWVRIFLFIFKDTCENVKFMTLSFYPQLVPL